MTSEELRREARSHEELLRMLIAEGALDRVQAEACKETKGQYRNENTGAYAAGILCIRAGISLMWQSLNEKEKINIRTFEGSLTLHRFIEGVLAVAKRWMTEITGMDNKGFRPPKG